jgi:hypothetical protein
MIESSERSKAAKVCEEESLIVEEGDRSQSSDPSAGSDHRWIEENLHGL